MNMTAHIMVRKPEAGKPDCLIAWQVGNIRTVVWGHRDPLNMGAPITMEGTKSVVVTDDIEAYIQRRKATGYVLDSIALFMDVKIGIPDILSNALAKMIEQQTEAEKPVEPVEKFEVIRLLSATIYNHPIRDIEHARKIAIAASATWNEPVSMEMTVNGELKVFEGYSSGILQYFKKI